MFSEHAVILDRIAKASDLLHQIVRASKTKSKCLGFLMIIGELFKVELVGSRVGVVVLDGPLVHMLFKSLEHTALQVD